jgi:hypothetical protein
VQARGDEDRTGQCTSRQERTRQGIEKMYFCRRCHKNVCHKRHCVLLFPHHPRGESAPPEMFIHSYSVESQ